MNHPFCLPVCYGDTDAGGVVYFARYLEMCERAWSNYLEKRGWDLAEKASEGILLAVKRVEAEYHTPARYGMTVEITTVPEELTRASFWFRHHLRDFVSHTTFAVIRTRMITLHPSGRVLRLPSELKEILIR